MAIKVASSAAPAMTQAPIHSFFSRQRLPRACRCRRSGRLDGPASRDRDCELATGRLPSSSDGEGNRTACVAAAAPAQCSQTMWKRRRSKVLRSRRTGYMSMWSMTSATRAVIAWDALSRAGVVAASDVLGHHGFVRLRSQAHAHQLSSARPFSTV